MKLQFFLVFFWFHFLRSSQGFIQNHVIPKIIIIPYIMASIISHALSLTGMSVKGTIFQPHSSHGSVTFLLTEAQNGNYFSFHYELSLFHLGTVMIDFHSSSVLPFLKPLTQTDTMKMQEISEHTLAISGKGTCLSWFVVFNMYWKYQAVWYIGNVSGGFSVYYDHYKVMLSRPE